MLEINKKIVLELYEQAINDRKTELFKDFISDDYIGVNGIKGVEGFSNIILSLIKAFPDLHYKIEEMIAENDKVFIKWLISGTHKEKFQNIEATGKTISNTGMAVFRLKDDKIISANVYTDRFSFLQQLGVLPSNL